MKVGTEIIMQNYELMKPLENRIIEAHLQDGSVVKARIVDVGNNVSTIKIVSNSTKE